MAPWSESEMTKSTDRILTSIALGILTDIVRVGVPLLADIVLAGGPKKHSENLKKRARLDALEREKERKRVLRKEERRTFHRDADVQPRPYQYQIGTHGNEALAIRYGIANQERKMREYWYHEPGGERVRNPDRDRAYYEPASTIRLQTVRKVSEARYEVQLTDFRDRRAIAVIEPGTETVKTFLPLDETWFSLNADLELTLKGNGTFSLKELARIHVDKAVGRKAQ